MTDGSAPSSKSRAVALTTFKRDGTAVSTPVWFYVDGDKLYTTTHGTAAKLKRLKNNSAIELAVCSQGGKLKGPVYVGTARELSATETEAVMKRKQRRYPIHRLMVMLPSMKGQVGLEIVPGARKDAAN